MTTLEDLYYGNIIPHEHSFKRGSAYSEVLLFPESNQQPHKQPEKEAPGCAWFAGLCEKCLWCRL